MAPCADGEPQPVDLAEHARRHRGVVPADAARRGRAASCRASAALVAAVRGADQRRRALATDLLHDPLGLGRKLADDDRNAAA